ncbi:MAG: phosphoglucosamine mutase [Candidatus Dadabacteria bacterium]|nr:MAG: phosphoglucosamine mutase [Candidatus Dadabacteria bacterium]
MREFFGTDGIRGVANTPPLDPESLVRFGQAIAAVFLKEDRRHRILIGKDTRLSGYMIETALASGITSVGVDVLLTGPITTPGVAYLTKSMRADAGIVISASHNPYEDNGIKIFGSDGYKLPDQMEQEIERLFLSDKLKDFRAKPACIGKASRIDDAVGRYTVFLKNTFPSELTLEGMRIGFDCANGASYVVAPQTCEELGAEVIVRGKSPNGRNINAGFGSLYPEIMQKLVKEQNLDIGISLDGDGDRAIFIDEKGKVHDGDAVLAICALDFKKRGLLRGGAVVGTSMSNLGLERALAEHGIKLLRAQVGDRYVLEMMKKEGCNLGGEQSGHTIFSDYATTGDGILTALMILAVMKRTEKPLSELASVYVKYPQVLVNVEVSEKPQLNAIPSIRDVIVKKEEELKDKGRILVRYSGTEDKARIMVECESEELCAKHANDVAEVIRKEIGAPL